MATFHYRAVDASGRITSGRMPAINASELEGRLRSAGLEMLRAAPARSFGFGAGGVPRKELLSFAMHMEQTLRAGLLITDALSDQVESVQHKRFHGVLTVVLQAVRDGSGFSDAMAAFPEVFDQTLVALVRSGESSGRLPDAFERIAASLKWQDELASQMKKLAMYPAFTVMVLIGVTAFVLLFLVPQLSGFIKEMSGGDLPVQTRVMLAASEFLTAHWGKLLLVPPALAFLVWVVLFLGGERLRLRIDRWKMRIPLVGPIIEKIVLARFTSLFGMLYEAGLPILQAVAIGRDAAGNRHVARALEQARQQVEQGKGIGDAFSDTGLFPNLLLRMIRIGESTGEIDKGLKNVSYFYNREINETIEKVEAMVEPALTLVLGLILGTLMMSVLGPIYDLLAKIKF
ncbi:MAG: type II secretion system F family protein [Burkholderiaceae bacterium]|nr:type II secretion system F family protein [Burkholderiaceae bacterium]